HPDHIGSARNIKEKSNCEVLAHEGEKEWIENIEKQCSDRPVPGFKSFVNKSVKIDKLIKDNDLIELEAGISIKIIHTPGHSKKTHDESRLLVIGRISGKHYSGVITYRGEKIRIISVRRARQEEVDIYED
ncbi:MAG: BrnT family toxin, partial [Candidatus Ratteibacteria bacterium]|nr:BrnT family toxin [Candidatus Ratteibacteria bacterium]